MYIHIHTRHRPMTHLAAYSPPTYARIFQAIPSKSRPNSIRITHLSSPLHAVRSAQLILLHFISTTAILINNQSLVTSSALRSNYASLRWNCAGPRMERVEQISHRPSSRLESLPVWQILICRLSYNDYARNDSFLNRN